MNSLPSRKYGTLPNEIEENLQSLKGSENGSTSGGEDYLVKQEDRRNTKYLLKWEKKC